MGLKGRQDQCRRFDLLQGFCVIEANASQGCAYFIDDIRGIIFLYGRMLKSTVRTMGQVNKDLQGGKGLNLR